MSSSGCAVTSCAMVAAYFGSSKNPGGLCRALNANGGLSSSGAIYCQKVPSAAGGTIRYIGRYNGCSLTRINQELDSGYPVIVEVRRSANVHFVVVTRRSGSTYYINDPGYGDRTTFNARYGSPSSAIHSYRIYHGTHKAAAPPSPYTRYEQGDFHLVYTGAWTVSSSSSASGSSFRYADTAGASVTATFNGTYLAWITKKSAVCGVASVALDGAGPVTVYLYKATTAWQQKVWQTGILPAGTHTVMIAWTGNKNAAATETNVGVDAFDLLGSLVPAAPALAASPTAKSLSGASSAPFGAPVVVAAQSADNLAFPHVPPWHEPWWLWPMAWAPTVAAGQPVQPPLRWQPIGARLLTRLPI